MATCAAQRKNGEPCIAPALAGDAFCFGHSPASAEQRAEARRQGGRGRSNAARLSKALPPHLLAAQEQLVRLLDCVERGEVPPRRAEAICAMVGRLIDLTRLGNELSEQHELAARIAELESRFGTERAS